MKPTDCYAGHYTSPEFRRITQQNRGVIVVCGSCEQHGRHLPLDTDNIIGLELALRIAAKTNLLVMPPVCFGQVWSAKGFPGTISLKPETLKGILREIVISLHQQNVRNIILMTGHNGNYAILKELARELLDEYGWNNIWHFPVAPSPQVMAHAKSPAAMTPHAGEAETAMMLYLRPELVDITMAAKEFPSPPGDYPYRPMHWSAFAEAGSFGDSSTATAEWGRELVESAVNTTADLILRYVR